MDADPETALVLSTLCAGGVRMIGGVLRDRGWRVVLVSDMSDDPNADACDEHVVVDWAEPDDLIAERIENAGVKPRAIVNMVEPLIGQHAALVQHFDAPRSGASALTDKAAVRRAADGAGVFPLDWRAGTLRELSSDSDLRYPVILKPAVDSGASRDVHLLRTPTDLPDLQATSLADRAADTFLIEEYLEGEEFSVDGYLYEGRFVTVFVADKPDHDGERLHDRGLVISPPVRVDAAAVETFVEQLQLLTTHLGLDNVWLHVEGRLGPTGRVGLIEINPRPAGGLYREAIRHSTGVDPIGVALSLALGEAPAPPEQPRPGRVADVPVEAVELGVVHCHATADDLLALPGVLAAYVRDGFTVTSLDQENFFAEFVVTGSDESELRDRAVGAMTLLRYDIAPLRSEAAQPRVAKEVRP